MTEFFQELLTALLNALAPLIEIFTPAFWTQYGSLLAQGTVDTLTMTVVSTVFAYALGLPLGVLLSITQPHGILPRRGLNRVLGWIINVGRSLPFIILMLAEVPLSTRRRSTAPGAKRCFCPTTSSNVLGRISSASGRCCTVSPPFQSRCAALLPLTFITYHTSR